MPSDRTRFVGEALAMVLAETAEQAKDAAELVEIDYEPLPAASHALDAIEPGAARLWDEASSNVCLDVDVGNERAAAEAFKRAAHVARLSTWVQRVIRDRDQAYGAAVTRRLRAMSIRDKPIAPGSPWQNGFAERLNGSIRRECTDHIIAVGEGHLRRVLRAFAQYYNESRTHRALDKGRPDPSVD
ncbi:MAG: hypothetical protein A3H27_12265 [Acidobacteria bacterium RIFCSPLOWO2_02_FULL_59_13]|nr:MAG: hypothetical protein A3H27_12265 [Acidobacteria bacterium RIFCSPLOWO2_02_FULL_59_13]